MLKTFVQPSMYSQHGHNYMPANVSPQATLDSITPGLLRSNYHTSLTRPIIHNNNTSMQPQHLTSSIMPTDYYSNCATPATMSSCYGSPAPCQLDSAYNPIRPTSESLYSSPYNSDLNSPYPNQSWLPASINLSGQLDKERGSVIVGQPPVQPPPKRKGGRKPKDDPNLPPIEKEKRRLRRMRNKEAAAKCRERRLNHTSNLLKQIEQLEKQQQDFETEIETLQKHVTNCEELLSNHHPECGVSLPPPSTLVKTEINPPTSESITSTNGITSRRKQTNPRLKLDTTCAESHRMSTSSASSDLQSPSVVL